MNVKRFLFLLLLSAALLPLCGCDGDAAEPESTPSASAPPASTPTPTPAPLLALYGAEDGGGFAGTARQIASSAACRFAFLEDGWQLARCTPEGRAALIYCAGENVPDEAALHDAEARGMQVYVFATAGQAVPSDFPCLRYEPEGAAALALDEAIAYPPHDTPVRLIGLFESRDGDAYAVFQAGIAEGKVLDKGAYRADATKKAVGAWLFDTLEETYAGMLDGIFCESPDLALAAAEALAAENRSDVEIFCAGANAELLAYMQRFPLPIVRAVGADPAEAGRLCTEQALILLYGGQAESLTIRSRVFSSGAGG